jgi:hypothetical protein
MPSRLVGRGAALALGALVVASTVARFAFSRGVEAPWIAPDEHLYGLVGHSLVRGEGLTILGEAIPYYSLLYPLFVGLPTLAADVTTAVTVTQAAQALLMSATAVPVFLWARPLAGARPALLAAGLAVLIPGLGYSALLMSEALYYPVAVVAAWALAASLREPTLLRQLTFVAAVALALAVRLQAVGFVATLVVALGALAVAERSAAPFRRLLPALLAFGAAGALWVAARLAFAGTDESLGAYGTLAEAEEYSVSDVLWSIVWQAGGVVILTVGVPVVALGILAWDLVRGREGDNGVRALVATALAYLVVTVVEVGFFASRFVEHLTVRQLLSVAPPVFVAFAVWLGRGLPRPQPVTSVIAFVVAAAALLVPVERVTTRAAAADALETVPIEYLRRSLSETAVETLYAAAVAALLLFVVFVPRRGAPVVAGIVATALAAGSIVASYEMRDRSQEDRRTLFADAQVDWLDAQGGRDVAFLVTGDRLWPNVWHHLFWNRSITRVVRLRGAQDPGVVPQEVVTIRGDGALVSSDGSELKVEQLVTPTTMLPAGEALATVTSTTEPGLTHWRVESPVRVLQRIRGLRPNGDLYTGESARIEVFACGPGELQLTLLGKEGRPTRIRRNGQVLAERSIPPETVWRPAVPAPADADGAGRCVYELESDGLVGSTRIEFVRSA